MAKSASESSAGLTAVAFPPPDVVFQPVTAETPATRHPETHSVLAIAAWHSLAWLFVANLIGVWLAILLLYPAAGRWLGEWSYGRWTPVHLNFQLYGWMALPLVAWAIRIYRADRGAIAAWSRTALILWSLTLTIGAVSWLNGNSSGKLFLDWTGYARVLFPLAILFLWMVLTAGYKETWHEPENRSMLLRAAKLLGLAVLLLVPLAIYLASDPSTYPAINPDTGGPTGASQLESTLVIVLILFLLPYGLTHRTANGRNWIVAAWVVFAIEGVLCLGLGRADVSHHVPMQFIGVGSLLIWVPLVPAYFNSFAWPPSTRLWRMAVLGYWALLVPTGWVFFLPGILDRLKFTDALVGHSILAMAGFVSSLLILVLAVLLDEDGIIFNARWPFVAWHVGTLGYVILFFFTGWKEGGDPAFTIVPGPAHNLIYAVRLVLGIAMTAASAHWLVRITGRIRSRGALYSDQPSPGRRLAHPEGRRS